MKNFASQVPGSQYMCLKPAEEVHMAAYRFGVRSRLWWAGLDGQSWKCPCRLRGNASGAVQELWLRFCPGPDSQRGECCGESRGGTNTVPCTWQHLLSQHKGRWRLLPLWVGVPWHSQPAWPLLLWVRVVQKPQIALCLPQWWGAAFFFSFEMKILINI